MPYSSHTDSAHSKKSVERIDFLVSTVGFSHIEDYHRNRQEARESAHAFVSNGGHKTKHRLSSQ